MYNSIRFLPRKKRSLTWANLPSGVYSQAFSIQKKHNIIEIIQKQTNNNH